MMALLTQLFPVAQDQMQIGFVVFLRVGAVMALLPAFGEQTVPQRVRLILAVIFTAIAAPVVAPQITTPDFRIGAYLISEIITGLALGLILRLSVLVLQMAGQMIAQATSLAQIFANAGAEPLPAAGHLMVSAGLALAVMSGLHVRAAQAIILSYDALPFGVLPDGAALVDWGVAHIAQGFGLALTLAMPFVIGALIYNLAIGVINRAMPQLMVSFIGAPAITLGGLALLAVILPQVLEIWVQWMNGVLGAPFAMPN